MATPDPLPPEVRLALEQGKLLEAIKLLRKTAGLGLKEAKDMLQRPSVRSAPAAGQGTPPTSRGPPPAGPRFTFDQLPIEAQQALRRRNKIEAIRVTREKFGLELKEAKDAVDAFERARPDLRYGLSPGEVPPSPSAHWILIVAVIVGFLAWWLLKR